MLGNPETRRLYIPHLIVAQSYNCNAACIGCNVIRDDVNISSKEMKKLIDLWAEYCNRYDNGKGIFHLKGGEPFMFDGVWETLDYVVNKGLYLFITTNGTFVDKEAAKRLNELYKKTDGQVIVSLDGSNEEINDLSRPGLYKSAVKAIENLVNEGIDAAWNYRIHKGNQNDVKNAVRMAKDLGVIQFNDLYHAKIRNRNGNLEIADLETVLEQLEELYDDGYKDLLEFSTEGIIRKVASGKYTLMDCPLGYEGLKYIQPDGKETSCPNSVRINDINKVSRKYHGRLVCKGELYASTQDPLYRKVLEKRENLIREKISKLSSSRNQEKNQKAIAWCFSRNW